MITFGLFALIFMCLICLRKKDLQQAIDVIDAAADFLRDNKRVLLVPILHFFFTLIVVILWMGAMICVVSLNKIEADAIIPQGRDLTWKKEVTYMALFMFFGLLWITAWIDYSSRFVVIVSASTYYFNNSLEKAS